MRNKFTVILFCTFMFLSTSAYGATFKGKVIDADTKEPIEGAVVVVYWHKIQPGGHTKLKDVKETLTDKNGEWKIKGPRGREGGIFTFIFNLFTFTYHTRPPKFIIFKPGYCPWSVSAFGIDACKEKLRPYDVGNGETAKLPRLTKREDRLRATRVGPIFDGRDILKKQKEFIRLLSEERKNVGLSELTVLKDLENEK